MNANVAQAYDAIAAEYDRQVQADAWIRHILWQQYLRCFRPGMHVLDVACGTGIDALFLAGHGVHVTGIDVSPAMVHQLQRKAEARGLAGRIEAHVADLTGLGLWPSEHFDGIISAFGGLNTVPDLSTFAADAARLVRPGGHVILHMVNRSSLWEWFNLVRRGRWDAARRLGRQAERTFHVGGQAVRHYLTPPADTYNRFFARHFVRCRCFSLGVLRPPPNKPWIPRAVVRVLGLLEQQVGTHRPFVNWGRFFVLDLMRPPR